MRSTRIRGGFRGLCCQTAITFLRMLISPKLDTLSGGSSIVADLTGKEEKVLLQTHIGDDTDHRLRSDRFAKILELGNRVIPSADLDVDVEYDCCVVAQYPIAEARPNGKHLNLILRRGRTQCRARERREAKTAAGCCTTSAACC